MQVQSTLGAPEGCAAAVSFWKSLPPLQSPLGTHWIVWATSGIISLGWSGYWICLWWTCFTVHLWLCSKDSFLCFRTHGDKLPQGWDLLPLEERYPCWILRNIHNISFISHRVLILLFAGRQSFTGIFKDGEGIRIFTRNRFLLFPGFIENLKWFRTIPHYSAQFFRSEKFGPFAKISKFLKSEEILLKFQNFAKSEENLVKFRNFVSPHDHFGLVEI